MTNSVMLKKQICVVAMAAATANVVSASDGLKHLSDTMRLHEVEVVHAAKAPVPLLPLNVTTVSETEINRSTESNLLPVLANRVPGMFVTERGMSGFGVSGGAAGTVNIRGVGQGNKVLFLIDGQPQWAGVFGHSLPDTYVTNDVARVEVVSGPSSLLYGSNAMGGSVNLITRRATGEGFDGSARLMWGSHATQKYGLRMGYRKNGWNAFVAGSFEGSHGHRDNMSYWLSNQYASLSRDFSRHWSAGANITVTETRPHNPGAVDEPLLDMWTQVVRTTTSVYFKNHYEKSSGGLQAYYNWGRHKVDDGHAPDEAPRDYYFYSKDYNMGITAYQTVKPWTGNNLSLGIDFKHWGGRSWNRMKDGSPDQPGVKAHVNEIAGYVMMQQDVAGDLLSVNGGVRLEHSSQFGNEWVPQAGFIFRPVSHGHLKFSYGKGFRSPNIRELYMYPPHNPDLKPEYLNNFEVELRKWFFDSRLNVGLALYYINGKDMIQTVRVDGRPLNVNTGSFINKGFEVDAAYTINDKWHVDANYAYLHTNTLIVAAPKNKLFGEIMFTPGQWQVSLESMNVWGLMTEKSKENYSLLNARVAFTIDQPQFPATLFVKGDNLTNKKYEINYGFPMPGATVMAGIDIRF